MTFLSRGSSARPARRRQVIPSWGMIPTGGSSSRSDTRASRDTWCGIHCPRNEQKLSAICTLRVRVSARWGGAYSCHALGATASFPNTYSALRQGSYRRAVQNAQHTTRGRFHDPAGTFETTQQNGTVRQRCWQHVGAALCSIGDAQEPNGVTKLHNNDWPVSCSIPVHAERERSLVYFFRLAFAAVWATFHTLYNYENCQLSGRQLLLEKAAQLLTVVLDNYFLKKLGN